MELLEFMRVDRHEIEILCLPQSVRCSVSGFIGYGNTVEEAFFEATDNFLNYKIDWL